MNDPSVVGSFLDLHSTRSSISVTWVLGFIQFTLLFSFSWTIVAAGLLTWQPKDLRDEGARLQTTTRIVDGSSLGIQDHNGDIAINSAGDEGNHTTNVILTASSVALDLWEEEDQARSNDRSQPKEKDCTTGDLMGIS